MSRISLLSAAFRDLKLKCGQHTLRPITAGTIMVLMDTKNLLFSDENESRAGDVRDSETMQAVFEFIWIHTAPPEDVVRISEDPIALRQAARRFGISVEFEDLEQFTQGFSKVRHRIQAAMVDPIAEKGEAAKKPSEEKLIPTGSPLSSSPSEEPVIPSASTSSSGASPSIGLSNTITPPSPPTETRPGGRLSIWEEPVGQTQEEVIATLPE